MPVHVIADLHGASNDLRAAVPEGSTLLLLGDLLNAIDYMDMSGILVEIFSAEAVAHVVALRKDGRLEEAKVVMQQRAEGREQDIRSEFGRLASIQYEQVFAALTDPTYVILGNVDIPPMAQSFSDASQGTHMVHGQVVEIEGERFGFVGGALPTPLQVAGEITKEEMRKAIDALGDNVDVLCTHIPPALRELCYDTLAERCEQGSDDLLEFIGDVKPRIHYFGHVHQPLVSSMQVGATLCINAGYFRATKRAFPHLAG
jgi:Icc-related predicted phosphoesterase